MADEPSWDDIFGGTAAKSSHPETAAPRSRRELRELERQQAAAENQQAAAAENQQRAVDVQEREIDPRELANEEHSAEALRRDTAARAEIASRQEAADRHAAQVAAQQQAEAQREADERRWAAQRAALAHAAAQQVEPDPVAGQGPAAEQTPTAPQTAAAAQSDDAPHTALLEQLQGTHDDGAVSATSKPPKKPRRERKGRTAAQKRGAWILVAVLVIVLGGGAYGVSTVWNTYAPKVSALFGAKPSNDYSGSGNGKAVQFTIVSGDIGSTIADKLAKADITKSSEAPYKLLLASPDVSFMPGTYSMFEHMSAKSAITRLQSADARISTKLIIPEGTSLKGIESLMTGVTKLSAADVTKAAADYTSYGLPANATSLEGYLFPATYDLDPGKTAHDYFQLMVDTMKKHLTDAGVAPANYEHTIIFASLIQKEAGLAADYPKVARVFQNRLDDGMLLQSDATVAYGAGSTDRVTTTDAQRADASNKYNTYVHAGLPVGPISNPGDLALNAAVHPAAGTWLYFVTVNLDTGETDFSTTYAEHQASVTKFQTWLRAHPNYQ